MTCQILFSGKNKKNIINLSSAENAQRVVKVKPHFYIVKLGFTGVYIIFVISAISAQKHRLAVLTSTHNLCFEQKYEKYQNFLCKKLPFFWW